MIQIHGPTSRLWINVLGTLMVTRLVLLILIIPFSEVKFSKLNAVQNTLLRVFMWKVNSYSSSQLRCHFLWQISTVIFWPLFFSLTINPTRPSFSLWAPWGLCTSVLNLMYWFVCIVPLHLPSQTEFLKGWMLFLTLKAGLCLVSHVHLIISWMNMV